jgi:hypothetical protein
MANLNRRKLPYSDRFSDAGISWISEVTSRSPIYGYVYITRTRKLEQGYLNLSYVRSSRAGKATAMENCLKTDVMYCTDVARFSITLYARKSLHHLIVVLLNN